MDSSASPDAIRRALLDFTDRRPKIWPGIDPSQYRVIEVGDTWADIREGTRAPGMSVWAVERYDWSDPETIKWTVRESNFSAPGSFVSAAITPKQGGGSHIHVHWDRTPSSFLGRVVMWLIRRSGGRPVATSMRRGLERIEAASVGEKTEPPPQ